jgi:GntR family transcriptional regulator / MocR family aminotransferase
LEEESKQFPGIQTNLAWDTLLPMADRKSGPLHVRLTNTLRDAIRSGRLPAGSALPPSRQLAADLECSRWVVTEAYEQLAAEGYLQARIGSATRVRGSDYSPSPAPSDIVSPIERPRFDFAPGLPDLSAFPRAAWIRAWREVVATVPHTELAYPLQGGHPRLRLVLAEYARRVRGAVVRTEDVTITTGILDGITQVTRALAAEGLQQVAVEDPCWRPLRHGVRRSGLGVVSVTVDEGGIRTDELAEKAVRAAVVAPAHQFPTGVVLTSERRRALVDWARRADGLILEDDYDGEFRYDRRPIGAMQGVDPDHVALFGSVSKTLAPGLRLGWMITPPRWTDVLRSQLPRGSTPSVLDQLALARFIETGAYDRHLRLCRRRYRARRDRLVAATAAQFPGFALSGAAAGMHIVLDLPAELSASSIVVAAGSRGVRVMDLGSWYAGRDDGSPDSEVDLPQGLVLGYGNIDDDAIENAVAEVAAVIETVR